jgi:IS5 family transposase
VRAHIRDRIRNRRINQVRMQRERLFVVIKRVFNVGYVLVTTVHRVRVKMVFACFCFNLFQLGTLAARS